MKQIDCLVCETGLVLSLARSKKAKKPKTFLMLKCPADGRHFRGFINDKQFVDGVIKRVGMVRSSGLKTPVDTVSKGEAMEGEAR